MTTEFSNHKTHTSVYRCIRIKCKDILWFFFFVVSLLFIKDFANGRTFYREAFYINNNNNIVPHDSVVYTLVTTATISRASRLLPAATTSVAPRARAHGSGGGVLLKFRAPLLLLLRQKRDQRTAKDQTESRGEAARVRTIIVVCAVRL